MGRKGWVTKMKEGLVKKHEQAFANHHPNPDQKLFDPNSPTILKLQCIVSGILSGQVTNSQVTDH